MALKATIYKAELQVADMDRHYYHTHSLTIAQHPSETEARMMLRLLAFALHADDQLSFTKGLSTDEEPDLWSRTLADEVQLWIEVGLPDERRVWRASHRAANVVVYAYGGRGAHIWWDQLHNKVARFQNVRVLFVSDATVQELAAFVQRTMRLQVNIQDGQVWISDQERSMQVELESWKA